MRRVRQAQHQLRHESLGFLILRKRGNIVDVVESANPLQSGFELDRERAVAKYLDGVLTLTLPKKAAADLAGPE